MASPPSLRNVALIYSVGGAGGGGGGGGGGKFIQGLTP